MSLLPLDTHKIPIKMNVAHKNIRPLYYIDFTIKMNMTHKNLALLYYIDFLIVNVVIKNVIQINFYYAILL